MADRTTEEELREYANTHRDDFDPDSARPVVPKQFHTSEERDRLPDPALQHHRPPYDSRPDTYAHSIRVGELMRQMIHEAMDRSGQHDLSKTRSPEVEIFDKFTPMLREMEYGSTAYKLCLKQMKAALDHHYSVSRHHPEHFINGINDMTLIDLMEMLADWKAATERMKPGTADLEKSFAVNQPRFGIEPQLLQILENTARHFKWMPGQKTTLEAAREMVEIQSRNGNRDYDRYMHGMYQGMELMLAWFEEREPNFRSAPDVWRKDLADPDMTGAAPVAAETYLCSNCEQPVLVGLQHDSCVTKALR